VNVNLFVDKLLQESLYCINVFFVGVPFIAVSFFVLKAIAPADMDGNYCCIDWYPKGGDGFVWTDERTQMIAKFFWKQKGIATSKIAY